MLGALRQGIPKSHIAKRLGKHRETIHIWIKGVQKHGLMNFLDRYRQAKKGERKRRQINPIVRRWVWEIREREYDCCGQKIRYFLELEHEVHLSVPKIYEVLKEKYVIRSKWKKNKERGKMSFLRLYDHPFSSKCSTLFLRLICHPGVHFKA